MNHVVQLCHDANLILTAVLKVGCRQGEEKTKSTRGVELRLGIKIPSIELRVFWTENGKEVLVMCVAV